jgi:hypothetical protein
VIVGCRVKPLKDKIVSLVLEEADQYLGMSMTYTLFEFLKERFDTLIAEQPENPETSEKSVTVRTGPEPGECFQLSNTRDVIFFG